MLNAAREQGRVQTRDDTQHGPPLAATHSRYSSPELASAPSAPSSAASSAHRRRRRPLPPVARPARLVCCLACRCGRGASVKPVFVHGQALLGARDGQLHCVLCAVDLRAGCVEMAGPGVGSARDAGSGCRHPSAAGKALAALQARVKAPGQSCPWSRRRCPCPPCLLHSPGRSGQRGRCQQIAWLLSCLQPGRLLQGIECRWVKHATGWAGCQQQQPETVPHARSGLQAWHGVLVLAHCHQLSTAVPCVHHARRAHRRRRPPGPLALHAPCTSCETRRPVADQPHARLRTCADAASTRCARYAACSGSG